MTGLLISITNLKEAEIAIRADVDILDMKNPAEGALGQLPLATITEIASIADKRCMTSATIGDLPMQPEILAKATERLVGTGVDIIKIGFFGREHHAVCASAVAHAAKGRARLIAVLMADQFPNFTLMPALKAAGFYGVMLDTAIKQGKHLLNHLEVNELQEFCGRAKEQSLVTGLAGSLRESHIQALVKLGADYLGFRGAVCANADRNAKLDEERLLSIKELLCKNNKPQYETLML